MSRKYLISTVLFIGFLLGYSYSYADDVQPINSCKRNGTMKAILYSDYCYDYDLNRSLPCADSKKMSDRSEPFDSAKYHAEYEMYLYKLDGTIGRIFVPLKSGQVTDICLDTFTPDDKNPTYFVGLQGTYPNTFPTFTSTNIYDKNMYIVIMPVANARKGRWSAITYFCKNDTNPNVTSEDFGHCDGN